MGVSLPNARHDAFHRLAVNCFHVGARLFDQRFDFCRLLGGQMQLGLQVLEHVAGHLFWSGWLHEGASNHRSDECSRGRAGQKDERSVKNNFAGDAYS